jgi:hypothetical protein
MLHAPFIHLTCNHEHFFEKYRLQMRSKVLIFASLQLWTFSLCDAFTLSMVASKGQSKKSKKIQQGHEQIQKNSKVLHSLEEIQKMSIPQAIQECHSVHHLLHIASGMWLPTDEDLLPHLRTQAIHHEKRIKAASQLLMKLGDSLGILNGSEGGVQLNLELWTHNQGLERAILAASLPFDNDQSNIDANKECRYVANSLIGIHSICGYSIPNDSLSILYADGASDNALIHPDILKAIQSLIDRAESYTWNYTLREACEVRWAIRGIGARLRALMIETPQLDERTSKLPFDILPSCLDWSSVLGEDQFNEDGSIKRLLDDIPFKFDTITTRSGTLVKERRSTAWIAEETIGSLAYSGKLMTPSPIPDIVRSAMRQVEEKILCETRIENIEQLRYCVEELGYYFDCSLCNHYPNEDSACKFHTDPEHGSFWERLTCVVSAGDKDVRKFAFRPIPGENVWTTYETYCAAREKKSPREQDDVVPAVIPLFPGDVVKMYGECNDLFHHAVYGSTNPSTGSQSTNGRVSLVFKRAIDRGGKKGHSKKGEGRRSKIL